MVGYSAGAVRRAVAAGRAVQAMCREAVGCAAEVRAPAIVLTFLRPSEPAIALATIRFCVLAGRRPQSLRPRDDAVAS